MADTLTHLHSLLSRAVVISLNRDGCDVYIGISREDSRLWALWSEATGRDHSTGPDPIALLEAYLREHGEAP